MPVTAVASRRHLTRSLPDRLRLRRGAEHLHRLGARPIAEFQNESAGARDGIPAISILTGARVSRPSCCAPSAAIASRLSFSHFPTISVSKIKMMEPPMIPAAQDVERVARKLWGEPNRALSKGNKLRFGANGSKSLDLQNLRWFDHEADKGGGYYKLFEMAGEPLPANVAEPHFVASYDYRDETNALLFQVVRKPKTAKPRFVQRRPTPGAPGKWTWSTRGVRRVLYRLPELLAADADAPVFVCEGEKDVDNVRAVGLTATCNPGGAGKWEPEYARHLRRRDVVVLPDADQAGRDHAALVVRSLAGVARSIRVLALPGLDAKGDVSDWFAAGGTREALLELVDTTPETKPGDKRANAHADHGPEADAISDDDAQTEIARLAALPAVRYARARATSAKLLDVPLGLLDRLVKAERGDEGDALQGKPAEFPEPELWPKPVNGAALLRTLSRYFALHTKLPPCAHHTLALWCVHCFCFDLFGLTPRLQITAATKEAGKSTLLELVKGVVPKPLEAESASEAFLFRVIALARPTLLLDEADTLLRDSEDLRRITNAGNRPGAQAGRCVGENQEPRMFDVHAPIAMAGIGRLHGTTESRAIRIVMQRRRRGEIIRPIDGRTRALGGRLCSKAARWVKDHATALRSARPNTGELINRAADLWRPLYAIADLAGAPWPDLVRKAQAAIRAASDDDADSMGEQLLRDLREVFGEWVAERTTAGAQPAELTEIDSAEIVKRLVEREGRPWAELPGRRPGPLTTARLARLLAPFKIRPEDVGDKHHRRKGYRLLAFADAFERHLP